MDLEQRHMPDVVIVLASAWQDPVRRSAVRLYAVFFAALFALPIVWAVFVERGVARGVGASCLGADAWVGRLLWLRPSESGLDCARLASRAGNIAGGALLFVGAVYFRFRFQIFLRGLARNQRPRKAS